MSNLIKEVSSNDAPCQYNNEEASAWASGYSAAVERLCVDELLAALRAMVDAAGPIGIETSYKDRERILVARAAIDKATK